MFRSIRLSDRPAHPQKGIVVDRRSNIQRSHLPPRSRPMRAPVPDVEPMAYALGVEQAAQMKIVVEERIGIADRQHDIDLT